MREAGRKSASGRWIRLPLAYDWILLLDADEVLTPELADENPKRNSGSALEWLLHRACKCIFWAAAAA